MGSKKAVLRTVGTSCPAHLEHISECADNSPDPQYYDIGVGVCASPYILYGARVADCRTRWVRGGREEAEGQATSRADRD